MINWGIIGCGDVAEVKSGPAFSRVKNSKLIAVMRRNAEKAKDFAKRHKVGTWYNSVDDLLANDAINAVYIASPPSSHLAYAKQALNAGKFVYLEKPMTLNIEEAIELQNFIKLNHKIVVAHYRRKLPAFEKVKSLLNEKSIGEILHVKIEILQSQKNNIITETATNWRLNPAISGGGYFHDIAPHQLDLMRYYFGEVKNATGFSNSSTNNNVDDLVNGIMEFENNVQFQGIWNFNANKENTKDECVIYGTKGSIKFSFYGAQVFLSSEEKIETFEFENPKHIQEPLISSTVNYFLNETENPCTIQDGLATIKIMDSFTKS